MTFADGTSESVDALVCATGYELDLPYLDAELRAVLGPDLALYQGTLHPDLPGFGVVGQFLAQGPYFPLLELQARWIVGVLAGVVAPPDERTCAPRSRSRGRRSPHHLLALTLAAELGVAPDLLARQTSPSRCCSDRCCRRATASTARAPSPRRPSACASSSPPRRARRSSRPTSRCSPSSAWATSPRAVAR